MPESLGAAQPRSPGELFRVFTRLALQGFGGVLPVAQHELVERQRWLDKTEFLALLSVAQLLPGPNVVNLALMIGDRFFGWRGAAAALSGMLLAPLVVVLLAAVLYSQLQSWPVVAGALRGMGVVAAGLVVATALKLAGALHNNPLGWPLSAALGGLTLLAVGLLRWPLAWVVFGLGTLATSCAMARLKRWRP
jgi:chromate transporter